jgi:hypothetical protein
MDYRPHKVLLGNSSYVLREGLLNVVERTVTLPEFAFKDSNLHRKKCRK